MYNIYKITNLTNGRTYIGMTSLLVKVRFKKHTSELHRGVHCNTSLQLDWKAGHDFIATKITHRKNKSVAKALETKLMNAEPNPYNIARGNPGDLSGLISYKFTGLSRAYAYAEIKAMAGMPQQMVMDLFNIGQPMVSMIQNGHRIAEEPQTSFKREFCCYLTVVKTDNPAHSEILAMYKETA